MAPYQAEQRTAARLDARGKLLVFGDLTSQDIVERKKKLWQSDPENPAYYSEYAAVFTARNHKLPPDFLETARRIAPDNAWFTYFAAARSHEKKLDLLREAQTQTKCTSYTAELLRQRLSLLPQGNLMERLDSLGCLVKSTVSSQNKFLYVHELPTAEVSIDADYFLPRIYQDEVSNLMDEDANARFIKSLAETFARDARELELLEKAKAWEKIFDDLWKRDYTGYTRKFALDGKVVESWKVTGSLFGSPGQTLENFLETPLPLTDADVKPGRLLDHEILSRFFNYICWLVMALCIGLVAAYRFRVSELSRRLAARMTELLRPADWAWIVGLGILLPFAFVMGINRLTPLGGRAFGMHGASMLMPAGHFLGLLILWLVVPVQIIRWRLARRAEGFGFPVPSRIGWVAVVFAAAFVPWIGYAAITGADRIGWIIVYSGLGKSLAIQLLQVLWPLGVPALWLCGVAARALFCRAVRHHHRAAAARALVVSWAAAMGGVCLASQGFKAAEHYWFVRDELGRMDPARPARSVLEYRTAAQLRKEVQAILQLHAIHK